MQDSGPPATWSISFQEKLEKPKKQKQQKNQKTSKQETKFLKKKTTRYQIY